MSTTTGVLLSTLLVLVTVPLAIMTGAAVPLYTRWLGRYPLFALIGTLPLAMMFGLVGGDLGLHDLFWDEKPAVQAAAGASVAALAVLLIFLSSLLEVDRESLVECCTRVVRTPRAIASRILRRAPSPHPAPDDPAGGLLSVLVVMTLPMVLLSWWLPSWRTPVPLPPTAHMPAPLSWYLPLGAVVVLLLAYGAAWPVPIPETPTVERLGGCAGAGRSSLPPPVVRAPGRGADHGRHGDRPSVALAAFVVFATHQRPLLRIVLVVGTVALMTVTNSNNYKLSYPGLEH